jgi:hypothetical protein
MIKIFSTLSLVNPRITLSKPYKDKKVTLFSVQKNGLLILSFLQASKKEKMAYVLGFKIPFDIG